MSLYKNIKCNKEVTTPIGKMNGCYICILEVGSNGGFHTLTAYYILRIYKDKSTYLESPDKFIHVDEIKNFTREFTPDFVSGADLFNKISVEVVNQLCDVNEGFNVEDFVIEE